MLKVSAGICEALASLPVKEGHEESSDFKNVQSESTTPLSSNAELQLSSSCVSRPHPALGVQQVFPPKNAVEMMETSMRNAYLLKTLSCQPTWHGLVG